MEENYYALLLSILKRYTPEQSFEVLQIGKIKQKHDIQKNDVNEMVQLKAQGLTYREIGEMFGISGDAAYTRIRRATGKLKK